MLELNLYISVLLHFVIQFMHACIKMPYLNKSKELAVNENSYSENVYIFFIPTRIFQNTFIIIFGQLCRVKLPNYYYCLFQEAKRMTPTVECIRSRWGIQALPTACKSSIKLESVYNTIFLWVNNGLSRIVTMSESQPNVFKIYFHGFTFMHFFYGDGPYTGVSNDCFYQ